MMTPEQKKRRRVLLKEVQALAPIRHTLPLMQRLALEVLLDVSGDELPPLMSPITTDPASPLHINNWTLD